MMGSVRGLRGNIRSGHGALVAMLATVDTLAIDATLVSEGSLESLRPIGADTLQAAALVLAAVLTLMSDFVLGLANAWMAEAAVDVLRGGASDRARRSRLG
jgi:hypothetical protein